MPYVQTSIHLLVDFHEHDEGTHKLADLEPPDRASFLALCADALHGTRPGDFAALHASATFRPLLSIEPGTNLPSFSDVNQALFNAVVDYNEAAFGLTFDTQFAGMAGHAAATPPPSCVQLVWVVDHWELKYNYNLAISGGEVPAVELPDGRVLVAGYRVALMHR